MTPNPFLLKYSSFEVDALVQTGSILPKYDGQGNLLIDGRQDTMASSSVTIPLIHSVFDPIKVELKYDVVIKELS